MESFGYDILVLNGLLTILCLRDEVLPFLSAFFDRRH
jgi:hypothetical protein